MTYGQNRARLGLGERATELSLPGVRPVRHGQNCPVRRGHVRMLRTRHGSGRIPGSNSEIALLTMTVPTALPDADRGSFN